MKRLFQMIRVEWLVAVFCVCPAVAPLLQAWQHSPFERHGWAALILWLIPAVRVIGCGTTASRSVTLIILSLVLSFVGVIGELNVLIYCGLAGIIGALAGVSGKGWLWLLLAVCWIPAFGFLFARLQFTPFAVQRLRLITAAVAAGLGLCWLPQTRKTPV